MNSKKNAQKKAREEKFELSDKEYSREILGVSMIWAAVIIASAVLLEGTGLFSQFIPIFTAGAAGTLIVIAGSHRNN